MAVTEIHKKLMGDIIQLSGVFSRLPHHRTIVDYDDGADVLYISFARPQQATDSEMSKDGILYRYCGKDLVGITIFDISKRDN